MLVVAVLRHEPQLVLNAMEQPVKHQLLAEIGVIRRKHVQGHAEPPHPAPGDRSVHETRKARRRPVWFRLARGTRAGPLVDNHQRTTERDTPQPARVSLAEPLGFLEVPLGELRLDLCIRSRCVTKQHEQE